MKMKVFSFFAVVCFWFLTNQTLRGDKNTDHCDKEEGCNSKDVPEILKSHTGDIFDTPKYFPPLDHPGYLIQESDNPQILWWYDYAFVHHGKNTISCSLGNCSVTRNRTELNNKLTRALILSGSYFSKKDLPLPRLPHHEWVLYHEESPRNQWMLSSDLGISLFNHTSTFRRESDYPISTQYIPDPGEWWDDKYFVNTSEKNRLQNEDGLAPAVFLQRNCNPSSDRDTYIKELMQYIKIDSFGPCLNNKKIPEEIDGFIKLSSEPYFHFLAKYKFQISFENAVCQDYMTEKIFRPLVIGSVPVYFGSPGIRDFMPSDKAVIVVTDFKSPKDLADYLKELNEDDNKYNEYLKHRVDKKIRNPVLQKILQNQKWKLPHIGHKVNFCYYMLLGLSCYVCDQLHERNNMLREHLKDSSKPIKPIKIANSNHMGCPEPKAILPNSLNITNKRYNFDFFRRETDAIYRMIYANETDSSNWKKYLR